MKNKLNLGCGADYKEDYVNLDLGDGDIYSHGNQIKVDVKHDFNKYPYPFKDNQFEEIYARACLEFMEDFEKGIAEFSRICKDGANVYIRVPYFSCGITHREFGCHVFALNHRQLFRIFEKNNFTLIEKGFFNENKSMKWIAWLFNISNFTQNVYERFFTGILPVNAVYWKLEKAKKI